MILFDFFELNYAVFGLILARVLMRKNIFILNVIMLELDLLKLDEVGRL